jgi:hypothetical protein
MPSAAARDHRLDFFRGMALFLIFIDHIPDNMFSAVTLQSFALSDAAEIFIFISGYTAALVYSRVAERLGALLATARIWQRVWQLYVAHLCLFMLYNAEVSYTMARFANPLFADEMRAGAFLDDPAQTILRVLLLQFQPTFLDILPLYIALLLVFPLILLALNRSLWLALLPSIALYAVARIWHINLPGYPEGHSWTFNPLAWQLLFVIGAACGNRTARGLRMLQIRPWLVWLAGAMVLAGALLRGSWILHESYPAFPALLYRTLWPLDKTELPLLRLCNMLAFALLAARYVPRQARFFFRPGAWLIVLCGRHSLQIFCLSILLSVMGNVAYTVMGLSLGVQIAVNAIGVLLMLGLGLLLSWFDGDGRLPWPERSAATT